ncbi:MAG: hypothetical protein JW822_07555 [Spirochaetales bacterium]|nr:hypothetical protein [Spirochaetales bacterium]
MKIIVMKDVRNLKTVISCLALMLLAFPPPVSSQDNDLSAVTVDKIPASLEEFIALRDRLAVTPQGGATVMIIACIMYTQDSELGEKCLVIALANDLLVKGGTYKGYALSFKDKKFLQKRIGKDSSESYIPRSYVSGTTPGQEYRLPQGKLEFNYSCNQFSGDLEQGVFKIFVRCSGADSPRPITLTRNSKGIWKAWGWHSLLVAIKAPVFQDDL